MARASAHVMGMRKALGEALLEVEAGDRALEYSSQIRRSDHDALGAAVAGAQGYYLSSIARSLLVIAGSVVNETEAEAGLVMPSVLAIKEDVPIKDNLGEDIR